MGQAFERAIALIARVFNPNTYYKLAIFVWRIFVKVPIAYIRENLWIQIVLIIILVIISALIIYFTWKNRKGYYGVDY